MTEQTATITDPHLLRLGKLEPVFDPRTLALARFVNLSQLPTAPDQTTRAQEHNPGFNMFGNDNAGDCGFAGRANAEEFWAAISGNSVTIGTQQVLQDYARVTGYDPATGANDNGVVLMDALNDWVHTGVAGQYRAESFASIAVGDEDLLRAAVYNFDGVYAGWALPITAQQQLANGQPFDYDPSAGQASNPGTWGGHCMFICDYNLTGPRYVTWGQVVQATWAFHKMYCDEQYAMLAITEFTTGGKTLEGLDAQAYAAALAAVVTPNG